MGNNLHTSRGNISVQSGVHVVIHGQQLDCLSSLTFLDSEKLSAFFHVTGSVLFITCEKCGDGEIPAEGDSALTVQHIMWSFSFRQCCVSLRSEPVYWYHTDPDSLGFSSPPVNTNINVKFMGRKNGNVLSCWIHELKSKLKFCRNKSCM